MNGHHCYQNVCKEHGLRLSECHCKGVKTITRLPCPCRIAHEQVLRMSEKNYLDPPQQ